VKTLVVSLIIWTFIFPCAIAIYLIVKFLGASMPSLYLALIGLVVALATLAIMRGLLGSSVIRERIPRRSQQIMSLPRSKTMH